MSDDFDDLYGSKYLGASALADRRRRAKIAKVPAEDLREKDGSTKRKYVVYFEGEERGLPLNKTNATRLALAFGKERENWVGGLVELYTETTSFGAGIRVRPLQQKQPPAQPDDELNDFVPL